MVHFKCRMNMYLLTNIARLQIPDSQVPWSVPFDTYNPPDYTSPNLSNKPWADPDIGHTFKPNWNRLDGSINRCSYTGRYDIVDGRPRNPAGRTGLRGRGILGKWGPNHAADPIVTRWKGDGRTRIHNTVTKLPILQFCAIQRKDCGEWAIPGGMVDPGELITDTLRREFLEEAFNSLDSKNTTDKLKTDEQTIRAFFQDGREVYRGYVDDPRNTDNAWMETVAVNFHDESSTVVGGFALEAGDDAGHVAWIDIDRNLQLFASHASFIEGVARMHQAHY